MTKNFFKKLFIGTTAITAGIAGTLYKHKIDSLKAIDLVTEEIGPDIEVVSSWTEPFYQRVEIDGTNKLCLVGGINITKDFNIIQYHFLVDAFSGEILDLKKTI
ncbi:hypothetical protein RD055328_04190 [Companilactobacillus sp. RD055328]|uniref:hypothetical protein n=1 Tax=Companilactobacillus sp. RD055328 TaxID=2916634 RepID=UPI001FC8CAAF|nr:hypothetical protein [Companilactobacillus sp. RD055328]GKQ42496.1 hypothetical protein RD055328_04190 [Companilactobacillus sp. RD055328]